MSTYCEIQDNDLPLDQFVSQPSRISFFEENVFNNTFFSNNKVKDLPFESKNEKILKKINFNETLMPDRYLCKHFQTQGYTNPYTRLPITDKDLIPLNELKQEINSFVENTLKKYEEDIINSVPAI